jgi:hypothetical protein
LEEANNIMAKLKIPGEQAGKSSFHTVFLQCPKHVCLSISLVIAVSAQNSSDCNSLGARQLENLHVMLGSIKDHHSIFHWQHNCFLRPVLDSVCHEQYSANYFMKLLCPPSLL